MFFPPDQPSGRERVEQRTLLQIRERKLTAAVAKEFFSLARYYGAQRQVFVSFRARRIKGIFHGALCSCVEARGSREPRIFGVLTMLHAEGEELFLRLSSDFHVADRFC
jgi:hypothetical protein